jgi:hypothetical protein
MPGAGSGVTFRSGSASGFPTRREATAMTALRELAGGRGDLTRFSPRTG